MHSKYDNMHNDEIFYALICINNHVISSINYMLSMIMTMMIESSFYFGGERKGSKNPLNEQVNGFLVMSRIKRW